eukprot:8978122-Prorocentrum_lima.AAC.1
MSTIVTGLSIDAIRTAIKDSVKEAVAAGFRAHGHVLETLKREVTDVYAMIAAYQKDTLALRERIA